MSFPAKTLSALLQRTTITDHEEVLRACNTSLKTSKNDLETQYIKVIALLKLDRYDDALRVLVESGDRLIQRADVERAYALYKVGELEEAKKVARGIEDQRGARHVEAQAVCILPSLQSREEKREAWVRCLQVLCGSHTDLRILRMRRCSTRNWREARLQRKAKRVT